MRGKDVTISGPDSQPLVRTFDGFSRGTGGEHVDAEPRRLIWTVCASKCNPFGKRLIFSLHPLS